MRKSSLAALFAVLLSAVPALAQEPATDAAGAAEVQKFIESLKFQSGTIALPDAKATLKLEGEQRFLGADDAERVLTQLWGNPPGAQALGLVLPSPTALTDENTYAVVVTYNNDGYVSDAEAAGIDYDKMLKEMQEGTRDENKARERAGYGTVELVGWATRPHYDGDAKKLYWAKELKFGGAGGNTINYDVRVLGRSGYLSLNAVAGMDQLEAIKAGMPGLIRATSFDEGARYADYNAKTDKIAGYGLAALVAGGVAAKAGLFGKLAALLVAGKKFVILGVIALAVGAKKIFGLFQKKEA